MLSIRDIHFEIAAAQASQARPNDLPQIAIAGRSNVGKSSFINKIANRKGLARASREPGRTRQIVMFRANGSFYLADLPGYGYAKVKRSIREEWGREIERYLAETDTLRAVALMVDIRRDLRPDDRDLLLWLAGRGIPVIPVATKMDKFAKNRGLQRLREWEASLEGLASVPVVGFSAKTGQGAKQAMEMFGLALKGGLQAAPAGGFDQIPG